MNVPDIEKITTGIYIRFRALAPFFFTVMRRKPNPNPAPEILSGTSSC